jgi:uncharacterized protein (TIGR03000 family)
MTRLTLGTLAAVAVAALLTTAVPAEAHFRGGFAFRGFAFRPVGARPGFGPFFGRHDGLNRLARFPHGSDRFGRHHAMWEHHGWYHGSWDHHHWSAGGYSPYAGLYAGGGSAGGGYGGGGSGGGRGYGGGAGGGGYAEEPDMPEGLYSYGAGYGYDSVYPDLYAPSLRAAGWGPAETLPAPLPVDERARLHIFVPPQAQLWVNGTTTNQTGSERHFTTAAIPPGVTYRYIVRARWMDGGKPVEKLREVEVQVGRTTIVNLFGAPSRG